MRCEMKHQVTLYWGPVAQTGGNPQALSRPQWLQPQFLRAFSRPQWLQPQFLPAFSRPQWLQPQFLRTCSRPQWLQPQFLRTFSRPLWLQPQFLQAVSTPQWRGGAKGPAEGTRPTSRNLPGLPFYPRLRHVGSQEE